MSPVIHVVLMAIQFLLHEVGQYVDLMKEKPAILEKVRAFVPGKDWDDAAAFAAGLFIDLVAYYMNQGMPLKDAAKAANGELRAAIDKKTGEVA